MSPFPGQPDRQGDPNGSTGAPPLRRLQTSYRSFEPAPSTQYAYSTAPSSQPPLQPQEPFKNYSTFYDPRQPPPERASGSGSWDDTSGLRMAYFSNYGQVPPYVPQGVLPSSSRRSTIGSKTTDEEETTGSDTEMRKQVVKERDMVKEELVEMEPGEKVDHRKRKRNRTIRSCVPCHNHKRKSTDESSDDPSVVEVDHLRSRIAELEQVVRDLRQRQPQRTQAATASSSSSHPQAAGAGDGDEGKKRRVIVDRFARYKIDEAAMAHLAANQDSLHENSSMSKYGAEPYRSHELPGEEFVDDSTGRKTFLGGPAGRSMLRRLAELTTSKVSPSDALISIPEDAAFKGVFPDMRKTFPFTTIWSHENFIGEIIGLLPSQEQSELEREPADGSADRDRPSVVAEFRRFFAMTMEEKMTVPVGNLALYLMICSLGCMMRASLSEIFGHTDRQVAKQASALGFPPQPEKDLTSSRLQSELYCLASLLFPLYPDDAYHPNTDPDQHLPCIAMGMHVDPLQLDPKISMKDAEVRRRIWWTAAGLDALLCVSFGRPPAVHFYTTRLPIDRLDHMLSDAPGSAQELESLPGVLSESITDGSYHTAYFQLTIPSFELLDRTFHVESAGSDYPADGVFHPPRHLDDPHDRSNRNTYEGSFRLADNVSKWYSRIPRDLRFEPEEDTAEVLLKTHSKRRINQILALCVKTFMLVLILHRPYLRGDPSAYPESAEICFQTAHILLSAYNVMSLTKSSIVWSWWTMSYRAFHAGAVVAFLAIRQPGTDLAAKCLNDLRGAIAVFEDRIATWNSAHPVQADLCHGLVKLERLATAATRQNRSHSAGGPTDDLAYPGSYRADNPAALSQIRAFPGLGSSGPSVPSPEVGLGLPGLGASSSTGSAPGASPFGQHFSLPLTGQDNFDDGFNGNLLHQFWASMFGIKVEPDGAVPA
ncbi:hypothetical protein P7C73_g6585, partial [Tremellales sp. Uapishka_1]